MGAGDRIPTRVRRAVHSTALAAACLLAIPTHAAALPAGDHPSVTEPATGAAGATLDSTPSSLGGATGSGNGLVADAALAAAGARPALEAAVGRVTETATGTGSGVRRAVDVPAAPAAVRAPQRAAAQPAPSAGGADPPPAALKPARLADREPARAARKQPRRKEAAHRSGLTSPQMIPAVEPTPATGLGAVPRGAGPVAGQFQAVLERTASPGPLPAELGGASISATPAGLSLGGLAVLLAILSLARPALTRRLPMRRPARRPAAFVPLPERPG
jgi:hypothetical protein